MNSSNNTTSLTNSQYSKESKDIDPNQDKDVKNPSLLSSTSIESNISKNPNNIFLFNPMPLDFFSNKEVKNLEDSKEPINKTTKIPLTGKAILSCFKTQKTAMILQNILMESSKEEIDNIINELSGNYRDLIKDKNGNYFCSDLFKICNQEQRIKILKELTKTISDDCVNRFGNHPIQTLIEYSACEEEYKLILNSFNDYLKLVYASFDTYGSYVIQKIIEHIPEKFRIKFNLLFIASIPIIAFQKFGVCTAKKFISYTKNEDTIEQIVNLIRKNFVKIATNNFGNFLIQYIIKKWNNTIQGNKIKQEIIYNFKTLSSNKYSSYICDFFLKISTREEKIQLFQLLRLESLNNNNFNLSQNYKQSNFGENKNGNLLNIFILYQNKLLSNELNFNCINNNNNEKNGNIIPFSLNRKIIMKE